MSYNGFLNCSDTQAAAAASSEQTARWQETVAGWSEPSERKEKDSDSSDDSVHHSKDTFRESHNFLLFCFLFLFEISCSDEHARLFVQSR